MGVIVNDEILLYTAGDGCNDGTVTKVNLNTGVVTNTNYAITHNGNVVSGKPIYYDGTYLWLLPSCSDGEELVALTTTTTKAFSANNDGYQLSYSSVGGEEYLHWFDENQREVYSYNIETATTTSLDLKSQLEAIVEFWNSMKMTVYNNKLIFYAPDAGRSFLVYDLTTSQFSTLKSSDWSALDLDGTVVYFSNGLMLGSKDKLVFFDKPSSTFNNIRRGYVAVTLTATPSVIVTDTTATITTTINVVNRAVGIYYTLSSSGSYSYYQNLFKTDVAINCKSGRYYRTDDRHIVLAGRHTYFAKPSIPNTLNIGSETYDVVSADKLPKRCLPITTLALVSYTDLQTPRTYNNVKYVYSSKKSNKMVLYDSQIMVYTAGATNTVTELTLTQPSASSSGRFYYPVSVNTEFDYWLYEDNNSNSACKLVSTTNTNTITIPGKETNNTTNLLILLTLSMLL